METTDFRFRHVPVRLPDAFEIRHRIAETAGSMSQATADCYLPLLGEVEPISAVVPAQCPWRLASYIGSYEQNEVIERAVAEVQRWTPLMRIQEVAYAGMEIEAALPRQVWSSMA